MKLIDRVTIITGAGGGIGRSLAERFAQEGSDIVIVYSRNDVAAQETAQIVTSLGRKAFVYKGDVSDSSAMALMVDKVVQTFGRIDYLINNAGAFSSRPVLELTEQDWDRVLDVDLKGTWVCTQAVSRYWRDHQMKGKVINIGSVHGTRAWKGACNYAAAKAGLVQLNRAMALELADFDISVNLVSPGAIAAGPNVGRDQNPDFVSRVQKEIPMRRMGEAVEVSDLCLFLASDECSYMTGSEIVIDGGLLLYPFTV